MFWIKTWKRKTYKIIVNKFLYMHWSHWPRKNNLKVSPSMHGLVDNIHDMMLYLSNQNISHHSWSKCLLNSFNLFTNNFWKYRTLLGIKTIFRNVKFTIKFHIITFYFHHKSTGLKISNNLPLDHKKTCCQQIFIAKFIQNLLSGASEEKNTTGKYVSDVILIQQLPCLFYFTAFDFNVTLV